MQYASTLRISDSTREFRRTCAPAAADDGVRPLDDSVFDLSSQQVRSELIGPAATGAVTHRTAHWSQRSLVSSRCSLIIHRLRPRLIGGPRWWSAYTHDSSPCRHAGSGGGSGSFRTGRASCQEIVHCTSTARNTDSFAPKHHLLRASDILLSSNSVKLIVQFCGNNNFNFSSISVLASQLILIPIQF